MSEHIYNPKQYRSPQRVWDEIQRRYLDQWVTTSTFEMWLSDGRKITIPIGFEYDKASIPRPAWWYLSRDDKHILIAALVHDYLYTNQRIGGKWITRKEADQIFYELIRQAGMRYTKAKLAYMAVRLGGWRYFNKTAHAIGNTHYIEV